MQWSFSEGTQQHMVNEKDADTFASVLIIPPGETLDIFTGANITPLVPMQLDRFVISLLDVSATNDTAENELSSIPRLQLSTGVKTGNYQTNPQDLFLDTLFENTQSDTSGIKSSVVFVGIGLDFDSGYLKGNAFVGRPLETLSNNKLNSGQDTTKGQLNTDAYGFEASAGYHLNNTLSLGGGIGRMTDKNKETDQTEEVYAVYAQAILAVAPGVQVKQEVGQVERVKDDATPEGTDDSFYAGTVWEINF
jgi:hypothetical protein